MKKGFHSQLNSRGYRLTQQRQAILNELRQADHHLTAREIYTAVRRYLPQISLGTVYRNLDVLEQLVLIKKFEHRGLFRYDADIQDHYHLFCQYCDRIEDIPKSQLGDLESHFNWETDFQFSHYQLDFHGSCVACQKNRADQERA
ncbi:MAG: transcriptional repressor [Candidatus Poribacteria bacterium]|nr:transcriptional repressor [Candidatus Poribacteria bacterium]MDP6747346.1 transcriptional repressor [Candidatus Poribacteria bacterium]